MNAPTFKQCFYEKNVHIRIHIIQVSDKNVKNEKDIDLVKKYI